MAATARLTFWPAHWAVKKFLRAYGGRSPKKQFAAADKSGARWAVIIGADEAQRGMVAVKDLRSGASGAAEQSEVRREEIAAWLCTRKDEATS